MTKKHSLHVGSCEFLRAEVDPNTTTSAFTIAAKSLRDILEHFALAAPFSGSSAGEGRVKQENQLGWRFTKDEVRIKTWETLATLRTEIKVDKGEFEEYWVEEPMVELTIAMKEFRVGHLHPVSRGRLKSEGWGLTQGNTQAALILAEQLSISLSIAFSEASQPVTVTSRLESPDEDAQGDFEIFCAIATTICDAFKDDPKNGAERKPTMTPSEVSGSGRPSVGKAINSDRSKTTSNGTAANGAEAGDAGDQRRSRSESSAPQKKQRTKLNMMSNSAANSQRDQPATVHALFGSQSHSGEHGDGVPGSSQRRQMTQQEVLESSGFGDMNAEDLMDGMDDAPLDEDDISKEGPTDHGVREEAGREEDEQENIPPDGISAFEPDRDVFGEASNHDTQHTFPLSQSQGRQEDEVSLPSLSRG